MRVIRSLASGSFGSVLLVSLPDDRDVVAVKVLPIDLDQTSDPEYDCLRALRLRGHVPFSVHALGAAVTQTLPKEFVPFVTTIRITPLQGYLFIVMPFIQGVTLRQLLTARVMVYSPLTTKEIASWTMDLVTFCYYAHDRLKLSHNDIKLGNVMMENPPRLQVIDFTFATRADIVVDDANAALTWQRGTLAYMPPEKLFFKTPTLPQFDQSVSDLWAVGTMMSTMALTGVPVFGGFWRRDLREARIDEVLDNLRFNPSLTDTLYQLLATNTPWFADVVNRMAAESGLDRIWVEQGVRLLLWTRTLVFGGSVDKKNFSLPGNEYMSGIERTPLHKVLDRYTDKILQMYDHDGFFVFEAAYSVLCAQLGPELMGAYISTQVWNPHNRGSAGNPFYSLASKLEKLAECHLSPERHPVAPVPCEGRSSVRMYSSLEVLLTDIQKHPCKQCKGPSVEEEYCSAACKAWDGRFKH